MKLEIMCMCDENGKMIPPTYIQSMWDKLLGRDESDFETGDLWQGRFHDGLYVNSMCAR